MPIDEGRRPNLEVTEAQLAAVNITRDPFHPEWNYTINPSPD